MFRGLAGLDVYEKIYERLKQRGRDEGSTRCRTLIVAYILLKTVIAKEHEVAQKLQEIEGVVEVKVVFGEYDVVAKAQVEDVRALDEMVTKIRKIDGIAATSTLIAPD